MLTASFLLLASAIVFYLLGGYFQWVAIRTRIFSYVDISDRFDSLALVFFVFSCVSAVLWILFD